VKVVAAPQLFATPTDLARKVVELADIDDHHEVLEPSAGTGALLDAIRERAANARVFAVEVNGSLAENLANRHAAPADAAEGLCKNVLQGDFLSLSPAALGKFDRHLCQWPPPAPRADGNCNTWEDLPAGSFKSQGTNVNATLVILQ